LLPQLRPDLVIIKAAEFVNSFKGVFQKKPLVYRSAYEYIQRQFQGRFWNDHKVKYSWKADIKGTGIRRNFVYSTKFLCMQFFIILDIEAISRHLLEPG